MAHPVAEFKADGLHVGIDVLHDFFTSLRREDAQIYTRVTHIGTDADNADRNQHARHGLGLQKENLAQFLLNEAGNLVLSGCFHITSLFFTYDSQTVAQGQDDFLHPWVGSHQVVEFLDADGLRVGVVRFFEHMPVPQGVVGNDVAAGMHLLQNHLVVFHIETLVSVDKGQVEHNVHIGHHLQGISDIKPDFIGIRRIFQPWTGEVFLLVVDLESVEHGSLFQTFCQTERRISAVSTYLKHLLRTYHLHEHLQHSSLQVARSHTGSAGVSRASPGTALSGSHFLRRYAEECIHRARLSLS